MKKKIYICFFASLFIACLFFNIKNSIEELPSRDSLIQSIMSPDGKKCLKIYRNNGNGATVSGGIIADVIDMEKNTRRNVYYRYRDWDAEAQWLDNQTVVINCQMIDVNSGSFNSKKEKGYQANSPSKTVRSPDNTYRVDVYHVYDSSWLQTSVKSYVDITNTINWTTQNIIFEYEGEIWDVGWNDDGDLVIEGKIFSCEVK